MIVSKNISNISLFVRPSVRPSDYELFRTANLNIFPVQKFRAGQIQISNGRKSRPGQTFNLAVRTGRIRTDGHKIHILHF